MANSSNNDWTEIRRKGRESVFNRLHYPNSNMDDLAWISLTVYVANFPSHLTVNELRNICGKAGKLVDVFIAKHKNALGQMFGFCRFIKVADQDSLINSLCKIWIGKLQLYASVARHDRNSGGKQSFTKAQDVKRAAPKHMPNSNASKASSYVNVARGNSNGHAKTPKTTHEGIDPHTPSITLTQDYSNDFPLALLGCYKDFRAIASTKSMCHNEGFLNVDFKYLGGLWVLFDFDSEEARNKFLCHKGILSWFSSLKPWYNDFVVDERLVWLEIEGVPIRAWDNQVFTKICNRWGEVIFFDDSDVCIKSTHANLIFISIMVTLNNVNYTIRVRELCGWTPTFASPENDSDEDTSFGDYNKSNNECKGDDVSEPDMDSCVGDVLEELVPVHEAHDMNLSPPLTGGKAVESPNTDPFELDELIKKSSKPLNPGSSITPEFPPGFSQINNVQAGSNSVHNSSAGDSIKHPGFSMLELLEETIKVGLALGLDMEGCEKTLASFINEIGDNDMNK